MFLFLRANRLRIFKDFPKPSFLSAKALKLDHRSVQLCSKTVALCKNLAVSKTLALIKTLAFSETVILSKTLALVKPLAPK